MTVGFMQHEQPTFHFLVMNVFEWRTGTDMHALMKEMDKQKHTYWVWYVPGAESSNYEISFYQPQVKGSFVLAEVNAPEKKRKSTTKKEKAND
jgi:hypothetical protein